MTKYSDITGTLKRNHHYELALATVHTGPGQVPHGKGATMTIHFVSFGEPTLGEAVRTHCDLTGVSLGNHQHVVSLVDHGVVPELAGGKRARHAATPQPVEAIIDPAALEELQAVYDSEPETLDELQATFDALGDMFEQLGGRQAVLDIFNGLGLEVRDVQVGDIFTGDGYEQERIAYSGDNTWTYLNTGNTVVIDPTLVSAAIAFSASGLAGADGAPKLYWL